MRLWDETVVWGFRFEIVEREREREEVGSVRSWQISFFGYCFFFGRIGGMSELD